MPADELIAHAGQAGPAQPVAAREGAGAALAKARAPGTGSTIRKGARGRFTGGWRRRKEEKEEKKGGPSGWGSPEQRDRRPPPRLATPAAPRLQYMSRKAQFSSADAWPSASTGISHKAGLNSLDLLGKADRVGATQTAPQVTRKAREDPLFSRGSGGGRRRRRQSDRPEWDATRGPGTPRGGAAANGRGAMGVAVGVKAEALPRRACLFPACTLMEGPSANRRAGGVGRRRSPQRASEVRYGF